MLALVLPLLLASGVFSVLGRSGSELVRLTPLIRNGTDDPRGAISAAIGMEITESEPSSCP